MWVLILMVTTGASSINLESVSGFTSERSCEYAGRVVKEELKSNHGIMRFACVRQEG